MFYECEDDFISKNPFPACGYGLNLYLINDKISKGIEVIMIYHLMKDIKGVEYLKFKCSLLVVKDMERSKKFYEDVLGQKITMDFGENVVFEESFSLQTEDSWKRFIGEEQSISFGSRSFELYFEEKHFEDFVNRLSCFEVELAHEVKECAWGQKVVRLFDPDHHMIEVGESMIGVVLRFLEQGLSPEETAERTQHPIEFVMNAMKQKPGKTLRGVHGKPRAQ